MLLHALIKGIRKNWRKIVREKNIFVAVWKDPVGSKIIANAIWFLPVSIATIMSFIKLGFSFLGRMIPLYFIAIIITIFLICIAQFMLKNKKHKDLLLEYELKMANLSAEINTLKLKPTSKRYNLFKVGDIVKNRLDNNMTSPVSYTVVEKTPIEIICVDKSNNQIVFSPEALSTAEEFKKQKSDYSMMLSAFWASRRK
jgi:hypothetical protein